MGSEGCVMGGGSLESVLGESECWEVYEVCDRVVLLNDGDLWGKTNVLSHFSWLQHGHFTSWHLWISSLMIW